MTTAPTWAVAYCYLGPTSEKPLATRRTCGSGYYSRYYGEFAQLPDGAAADEEPGFGCIGHRRIVTGGQLQLLRLRTPHQSSDPRSRIYSPSLKANLAATSTMITTGCILSAKGRADWREAATEPLPSYLHRLGIKTFVRTNNTEMPRLNVGNYQTSTTQLASVL